MLLRTWSRALVLMTLAIAAPAAAADRPPLLDAAKSGDTAAVRELVRRGADVNAAEADGTTALHWASYRDDPDSVDLLLRGGARVNAATDLGVTPLWAASQNGSERVVTRLLAAGANPNAALTAGETPLMVAARGGHAGVVARLLAKGANVNAQGARRQTALMWAASQKHPEVVKLLLQAHADVHARSDRWSQMMAVPPHGYLPYNKEIPAGGETALLFAARVGDAESAAVLVGAGANVNDADAWGVSATSLAAHSDFRDVVALLLEKGADPNAAGPGFTALHSAIMHRDEALARLLLDHGADANLPLRTWTPMRRSSHDFNFAPELVGTTPYWLAARFNECGIMRLLADHGADTRFVHHGEKVVEGRNGEPFQHRFETTTALMAAAGMGGGGDTWAPPSAGTKETRMLDAVTLALSLGADINAANTDGRTALDAAETLEFDSVVEFLTAHGGQHGKKKDSLPAVSTKDDPR
jgi:ankyrin repeat protein